MNTNIFLGLGSNLGNRIEILNSTRKEIEIHIGEIVNVSSLYQTKALGFESESYFINQVIEVKSQLNPFEILKITQKIERELGRLEKSKNQEYSDRIIDIDILFYNQEIIESDDLHIPHKELYHRNFVLVPLGEINMTFIDPKTQLSVEKLIELSHDKSEIIKY
ncbi:MAG: 2-amino-4-hydroxy-6-hydroxymethyldihydropteridine diphosphokinase [Flavobacteriia bacterium]